MSDTRFLSGRQRRIRLHGTYSYDVLVRVFGNPSVVSQNTSGGVTTYYPQIQGSFVINGDGRAGLDRPYVEGLTPSPFSGPTVGFGATARFENTVYSPFVGGTTDLVVRGAAREILASASYSLPPGVVPPSGITSNPFFGSPDSATHTTLYSGVDSGTWEVYVDVEEVIDHLNMPGQSGIPEPYLYRTYYEVYRPGGELVRRKVGGATEETIFIGGSVRNAVDNVYHPFVEFSIACHAYSGGPARTGNCTITAEYDGDGFTQSPRPFSFSGGGGTGSESSVTMTNGTGGSGAKFPIHRLYTHRIRGYTLSGVDPDSTTIYAVTHMLNSAFTSRTGAGELVFAWLWKNDSGGIGFTPDGGSTVNDSYDDTPTSEEITGTTSPIAFRDFNWIGGPPSAPSNAGDKTTGYVWYEGKRGPYATVYHTGTKWITRDPFQPIVATLGPRGWLRGFDSHGANNTIPTLPGGTPAVVRLTVGNQQIAPFTLNVRRQFARLTENINLEGRYIKIRVRSVGSADQPLRLVFVPIGGGVERWVFDTTTVADGTFVERRFDLLDAGNVGAFETGTEIPQTVPRDKPEFTNTPPRQLFAALEIDRLNPNTTYEIEWVKVEREGFATVHGYGNADPLVTMAAGGIVDGLPSPIPALPLPTLGTGENPSVWDIVETAPPTPGKPVLFDEFSHPSPVYYPLSYLLESDYAGGPGTRLWGAGLTRDGSILDMDATDSGSPVPLDFFMGGVFLSFYPGCGDIFQSSGGGYDNNVEVIWTYPSRNAVHGLMLGSSGEVVVQQRNDANTADENGESGRGSPDSNDYFTTGAPYLRPRKPQRLWVDPDESDPDPEWLLSAIPSLSSISHARRWVLIRLEKITEWLSADIYVTGRAARTFVSSGTIRLEMMNVPDGSDWSEKNTEIEGTRPCLRYHKFGPLAGTLVLVYEASGDDDGKIFRQATDSEGESFSMAATIFDGEYSYPCVAISPTGVEHHFAIRDSDSAIRGRVLDAFGNELVEEFTAVDGGSVTADAIAAFVRFLGQQADIFLLYHDDTGDIKTVRAADWKTFS